MTYMIVHNTGRQKANGMRIFNGYALNLLIFNAYAFMQQK
jgi:hypothetical protein